MKKLLGIVTLVLLCSSVGMAEIKVLEERWLKENEHPGRPNLSVICIDGLKFGMAYDSVGKMTRAISLVQIFEERDGKSLPAKC